VNKIIQGKVVVDLHYIFVAKMPNFDTYWQDV